MPSVTAWQGCQPTRTNVATVYVFYFGLSRETVSKETYRLLCRYDEHNALVGAIIDVLDNTQELLSMVQENYNQKGENPA